MSCSKVINGFFGAPERLARRLQRRLSCDRVFLAVYLKDLMTHDRDGLTREILAYLCRHPDAGDTVEGIAEWWLMENYIRQTLDCVRGSLNELVDRGWVIRESSGKAGDCYRLDSNRAHDVRAYLQQQADLPEESA